MRWLASPTGTFVIEKGRVAWTGTTADLKATQDIKERFLHVVSQQDSIHHPNREEHVPCRS